LPAIIADISGLELVLNPNVAGRLIMEGNAPPPKTVAFEYQRGGCSFSCSSFIVFGAVDAMGVFQLAIPEGHGTLRFTGATPNSYSATALIYAGTDLLQDLRAQAFTAKSEVELRLSER
jgi:hypothetical protein